MEGDEGCVLLDLNTTVPHQSDRWRQGLQQEDIARFPIRDEEIAPTRLGNALRAAETYGSTRFRLDTQVMWSELCSVAPKYLQTELERSRAIIDFFVAQFYLSLVFGVVSIAAAFDGRFRPILLVIGVIALVSMAGWYNMAVVSTSYYAKTIQALVNLGRVKLANELGFFIPYEIAHEHRMWWLLMSFVSGTDLNTIHELNEVYRTPKPASPVAKVEAPQNRAPAGPADQEDEEPDEGESED